MRAISVIALLLTCLFHSGGLRSDPDVDFLEAAYPILQGDPLAALPSLELLARSGNGRASVMASRFYREAHYLPTDYEKSCFFAELALEQGSPEGAFEKAYCLVNRGALQQSIEVQSLLEQAISEGSFRAKYLQTCSFPELIDERSNDDWLRLASILLEKDDPFGALEVAKFLSFVCGALEDFDAAHAILEDIDLPLFGEKHFITGGISEWSGVPEEAQFSYIKAYRAGHLASIVFYANTVLYAGVFPELPHPAGANESFRSILSWKRQPRLMSCYIYDLVRVGVPSLGIERDEKFAFPHTKACAFDQGNVADAASLNWLAIMHNYGLGTERNQELAIELFKKAYEHGDANAATNIGLAYESGDGVRVNYEEALNWFRRSLDAFGDDTERATPIFHIGRFYESGLVVEQNHEKAATLYRQAIELSPDTNPIPYIRLGDMIRLGHINGKISEVRDFYLEATKPFPLYETYWVGREQRTYQALAQSKLESLKSSNAKILSRKEQHLNTGNFYALLFGANEYEQLPPLTTPVQDTRDLSRLLETKYGFKTTVIENPSRRDILGTLSRFRKALGPQDNLLIYFAGHGVLDADLNMGFWQPVEAEPNIDLDWIPTDRITRTLRGFGSSNILVIADSCYSAAILRGNQPAQVQKGDVASLQSLIETKTRVALTSGGLAPVADNATGGKNSVFASALQTVLGSETQPITATEVFFRVRGRVSAINASLGFAQSPEFSSLLQSGHEGGDFVFVPQN